MNETTPNPIVEPAAPTGTLHSAFCTLHFHTSPQDEAPHPSGASELGGIPSGDRLGQKIARLPKPTRDMINLMLDDGLPYHIILDELAPAVSAVQPPDSASLCQGAVQAQSKLQSNLVEPSQSWNFFWLTQYATRNTQYASPSLNILRVFFPGRIMIKAQPERPVIRR